MSDSKPKPHYTVQVIVTQTVPPHKSESGSGYQRETTIVEREVVELAKFTNRSEDLEALLSDAKQHIDLVRTL